jgi:hypothetical protein
MPAPYIRLPRTGNPTIDRQQQGVSRDIREALASQVLGEAELLEVSETEAASNFTFPTAYRVYTKTGNLTQWIRVFSSNFTIIPHNLGRAYRGYLEVGKQASSNLFDPDPTFAQHDPTRQIALRSSSTNLFKVVIF